MRVRLFHSLSIFALAWMTSVAEAKPTGLPNIVVILVDDMGYGDPGCYNPESKILTPAIDSLARSGMRFTDAHAAGPLCHSSRYGLMTGRYPFRTDVTVWQKKPLIKKDQVTIASLLKEQGYYTSMVGKWHLGFHENGYDKPLKGGPVDCGFDSFFGMRASTDIPPYFYIRDDRAVQEPSGHIEEEFSENWSKIQGRRRLAGGISADMKLEEVLFRFTDEAISEIKKSTEDPADQPLFLYLAYPSPHTPWLPSEAFIGKSGAGLYGDFVMTVDAEIGRVLDALRDRNMEKDTLVVFASDNGPCWFDEDVERFGHDSAGGLRGMKSDAWEAGHRMPFIMSWPSRIKAGSITDQTICFTDLMATFSAISHYQLPYEAGLDSFDLIPVLAGRQPKNKPIRGPIVMKAGSCDTMLIRKGNAKLITALGSGGFSDPKLVTPGPGEPAGQLYNLKNDPAETKNLYLAFPELVNQLTVDMNRIVEQGRSRIVEGGMTQADAEKIPVKQEKDPLRPYVGPVVRGVDTSTLAGKVMTGYQGWFNCEGDGAGLGWTHWAKSKNKLFGPGNITVDLWPEMSEYNQDSLFETGFKYEDGRVAKVFSSHDKQATVLHFEWMRDYGIDGAFIQRFAHGLRQEDMQYHKNVVLANAREAANRAGRTYAVMYDLSGLKAGGTSAIIDDWNMLQGKMKITDDPAYQHHNGKPIVSLWGIGFNENSKPREYTLEESRELILFFKENGCSVKIGSPTGFRELERDSLPGPEVHEVLKLADVISPWAPGRYRTIKGVKSHAEDFWNEDEKWCTQNDLDYMPVIFPGFSWHNLKGDALGSIPRLGGMFLWEQVKAVKKAGCDMLYIAMFDEVDEGTAIFKCTNEPPTGNGGTFLTYEGLPSDHYLWLSGQAGKLLRDEIPLTVSLPVRTTDATLSQ
jgi:arylsulfatase A